MQVALAWKRVGWPVRILVWNRKCSQAFDGRYVVWTNTMKIVWRNPNRILPSEVSIVSTGSLQEPGRVQRFYRSSSGLGILGTNFELWVNCEKSPNAA